MGKWTKGDWMVDPMTEVWVVVGDPETGSIVADCENADADRDEILANARLIAAAPEMAVLLQELVDWAGDGENDGPIEKRARAILSRIEGEG